MGMCHSCKSSTPPCAHHLPNPCRFSSAVQLVLQPCLCNFLFRAFCLFQCVACVLHVPPSRMPLVGRKPSSRAFGLLITNGVLIGFPPQTLWSRCASTSAHGKKKVFHHCTHRSRPEPHSEQIMEPPASGSIQVRHTRLACFSKIAQGLFLVVNVTGLDSIAFAGTRLYPLPL